MQINLSAVSPVALYFGASVRRFWGNCDNIRVVGADIPNITLFLPQVSTVRLLVCYYYSMYRVIV